MIVKQAGVVIDRADALRDGYCIYEHWLWNDEHQTDVLIYMGTCRLRDVFTMPDAWNNSEWIKFVNVATVLTIKIVATGTQIDCVNARGKMLFDMATRPHCNERGYDLIGRRAAILCNETHERFNTQQECCRAHNINQGQLSAHLNGQPGARTIKGRTYRRE